MYYCSIKRILYILFTISIIASSCSKDSEYEGIWIGTYYYDDDGQANLSFNVDADGYLDGEFGESDDLSLDIAGRVSEGGIMTAKAGYQSYSPGDSVIFGFKFDWHFNGKLYSSGGSGSCTQNSFNESDSIIATNEATWDVTKR